MAVVRSFVLEEGLLNSSSLSTEKFNPLRFFMTVVRSFVLEEGLSNLSSPSTEKFNPLRFS
jgi:hypothetical protein